MIIPVNIFEFCKHLKGNVWQRLKIDETIYNSIFSTVLCIPFIICLVTNVRKTLQMNIIISQKYYLNWGQIQPLLRMLTHENIIFMSKIAR